MIVIAHRGWSGKYPENTLIAFQKAIHLGVDAVELDVTLSYDSVPVVIHDDTLDRTMNAEGPVRFFSYSYLKTLDAGIKFNKKFINEKLPSLEDTLKLFNQHKTILNIEIKSSSVQPKLNKDSIERKVLSLVKKYKMTERIIISSFSKLALTRIRKIDPKIKLSCLFENYECSKIESANLVKKLHPYSYNLPYEECDSALCKELLKSGFKVILYTVNNKNELKKSIKSGVHGIFTDHPDKMKRYINEIIYK